jgi:integrase
MTASRVFARVSNHVGFDFTAHDLRRTVATVASELNYDINSIGLVLNHARGTVTSRYIQGDPERLRKILTDIQDALFPQAYN